MNDLVSTLPVELKDQIWYHLAGPVTVCVSTVQDLPSNHIVHTNVSAGSFIELIYRTFYQALQPSRILPVRNLRVFNPVRQNEPVDMRGMRWDAKPIQLDPDEDILYFAGEIHRETSTFRRLYPEVEPKTVAVQLNEKCKISCMYGLLHCLPSITRIVVVLVGYEENQDAKSAWTAKFEKLRSPPWEEVSELPAVPIHFGAEVGFVDELSVQVDMRCKHIEMDDQPFTFWGYPTLMENEVMPSDWESQGSGLN